MLWLRVKVMLVITTLIATAIGCGEGAASSSPQPNTTAAPQPEHQAAAGARRVLVRYRQTGGLAGVQYELEISTDGVAHASSRTARRQAQVPGRKMRLLRNALNNADFPKLASTYRPPNAADVFLYTITYRGYQVTMSDGGHPPPRLLEARSQLASILHEILPSTAKGRP
jgi:hypothetical protein